ncbi:hypothetical protein PHMEG_0007916 [Phytophthora megakarya]|uniref:Uncharacterized protein n=1 Tax=Phytophthora megakarya TaxID=4795 RepID=A0A225WKI1_9STRA|nr:hypothetical protein PHMEG_0007916 [Phytophthora megakarya]
MQRAARGLDVPQGTAGQESAALKCFGDFLSLGKMSESSFECIAQSLSKPGALPSQNFYSLLTAVSIFLQTRKNVRGGPLAKATAVVYMSQVVSLLHERYPTHLSDSKMIAKIREKMAAAIDERNLLAGVQTGEAPGCTLNDLRTLVQYTAIMGVGTDTCFARKNQLSGTASGELLLHVARIKTSVVQGISIYKAAEHWEQCMFHALGMLFAGTSEPSCYIFPLSDLPGETAYSQDEAIMYWVNLDDKKEDIPAPKRVRGRPNVSKYINDVITEVTGRAAKSSAPLPPDMTAGLPSHSLRRGAAAYANACPKLVIQWISTRGAWLVDSLPKAFAYVATTTR